MGDEYSREVVALAESLSKVKDFHDLEKLSTVIAGDLKERFALNVTAKYVTAENAENCFSDIKNGKIEYPYIVVRTAMDYKIGAERKYNIQNAEGKTFQKYYDENHFMTFCRPVIDVITDNEEQMKLIIGEIEKLYVNGRDLLVDDFIDNTKRIPIYCIYTDKSDISTVSVNEGRNLYYSHVGLDNIAWPQYINAGIDKFENGALSGVYKIRKMQLAQACCMVCEPDERLSLYDHFRDEIKGYSALIKPNNSFLGKVGAFLSTYNSDAYQELKLKYNTGEVITPDLVDAAFPRITVFYRNLPNDILKGTPETSVEAQVKELVNRYKVIISEIGKEFDIPASTELMPADCNAVGHDFKVWGKEGFGYIVDALKKNANRQISSIAREYINMVRSEVQAYKRKEEAERRAREEAREYEGSAGGGLVSSMAGAYVGAKMANRGTKKSSDDKPHLRGSARCMKNTPGTLSCVMCPQNDACADRDF